MNKKTVIGVILAIIIVALIIGVYFFSNNNHENTTDRVANSIINSSTNSEEDTNLTENNQTETSTNSRVLITYFSVPETTDPNNMTRDEDNSTVVVDGEVLGNTQYVANLIAEKTGGEIFRLEPVDAYPTNHEDLLTRAAEEMDNDARLEIKDALENLDNYDMIFIGYPIWNSDLPPIINTFLEQYDFEGKTVIPFCTHGGSGLSGTPNTIARKLSNSTVITNGFSLSRTRMETAPTEVDNWLKEINVIN